MRSSFVSARGLNLVWLGLLGLTLLSYRFAESGLSPQLSTPLVLASAVLKALLIGLVFMELLRCPRGLQAGFMLFFCGLGLGLALLLSV